MPPWFRSPHGFADIDMATMCQQLQREEDNLCAQRGLVQGQDTQTFSMRPYQSLMEKWRKLAKAPAISQVKLFTNVHFCAILEHFWI